MQLIVVPDADRQILTIDEWWRANRSAAPDLFAEELASALLIIQSSPRIGRRRRHRGVPGLRRVLLRSSRYHVYYAPGGTPDTLFVMAVWSAVRGSGPRITFRGI